jgi:predicted outer membrane lipoprotein
MELGNRRGHVSSHHGVFLKCAFGRLVALWVHADSMAHDTVTNLEARDTLPHLDDLAGEIATHNEGIFDPGEHQIAGTLFEPVKRVDGNGSILDHYLAYTR